MDNLDAVLALGGGVVLLLGVLAGWVKNRLWTAEPVVCLAIGVALGPSGGGLIDLRATHVGPHAALEQLARVTLGLAVMGAALRLPHAFASRRWRSLAVTLAVGMPLMWLSTSALALLLLPASLLTALLIGACLAPTDPVVSGAVVTGRLAEHAVPLRLRHGLSAESGANDGLGVLLVMLPILLITRDTVPDALIHWATVVLLWEVLAAVAVGVAIGWLAGRILVWSYGQPFSERHSTITVGLALSLTVLASVKLLHSDGILAVFAAGLAFNRFVSRRESRHEHLQEAIGRFFDLPVFLFFGMALPWDAWRELGWAGPAFVAAVLLLRRLPWWLALRPVVPWLHDRRDALFAGWFGPIGIASMYYALVADDRVGAGTVWPVASLAVAASTLVHGLTAVPLTRWYGGPEAAGRADAGEDP